MFGRKRLARDLHPLTHLLFQHDDDDRGSGSILMDEEERAPSNPCIGTFGCDRCYAVMTQPDTWYVAFGPDKTVKTDDSAESAVRSTRTFRSEVDAKLFAMQILAKGWSASAGTLNPHQPKQVIGASQIEKWVDPRINA